MQKICKETLAGPLDTGSQEHLRITLKLREFAVNLNFIP